MDATAAIEHNREALKRIVAMLVATFVDMAGLATGNRQSAMGSRQSNASDPVPQTPTADCRLPTAATLPRHLYLFILRLLRPAESAARRLIIVAARGLAVPPPSPRKPKPGSMAPLLRSLGLAVTPGDLPAATRRAKAKGAVEPHAPRSPSLPLFDPPRRLSLSWGRASHPRGSPRILFPGYVEPSPLPAPPSPRDRVDATRLGRRLAALTAALDDLPGQARRFARWKARLDAARDDRAPGRFRRISPLRRGRPPGGRLTRYDPSARREAAGAQGRKPPRNVREVDEILAHAHSLALYALENPDTS